MANVKISYNVALEDLPVEVGRIVSTAIQAMEYHTSQFRNVSDTLIYMRNSGTSVSEQIKILKNTLESQVKCLNRLDEMLHILEGYEDIKNKTSAELSDQNKDSKEEFSDS
jgi:hypothetical protein